MIKDLTEAEKGYIAGFLDGEGYLSIVKQGMRKSSFFRYSSQIGITNTDRKTLEWVKLKTGIGNIRKMTGKSRELFWKDTYRWILTDRNQTIEFFKIILPYLKIKKKQAELILKLKKGKENGNDRFSLKEREFRESLYQKNKLLNKRGINT